MKKLKRDVSLDFTLLNQQLPFSDEAEQGVLSCLLQNPEEYIPVILSKKHKDDLITHDGYKIIFKCILDLYEKGIVVENDPVTITHALRDANVLDKVGSAGFISELFAFIPIPNHFPYYISILEAKLKLRNLIINLGSVMYDAFQVEVNQVNVNSFISESQDKILSINENDDDFKHINSPAMDAIDDIQYAVENPGKLTGLSTGFKQLDDLTTGLKGGEMFVLAARPSMGKTSLVMNIIENIAIRDDSPVAIFSLEVTSKMLVKALICRLAGMSMHNVSGGTITRKEQEGLAYALRKIQQSNIFIDDTSSIDVSSIVAKSRRLHKKKKIKLIAIDYLQLVTCSSNKGNRETEISTISAKLKNLSKELNIPIIVLAQLNRAVENRKEKRPMLSDLRESGSIEQDADLVGLLTRSGYFGNKQVEDGEVYDEKESKLILAKNRNGPTGDIDLLFDKELTRFTEPNN